MNAQESEVVLDLDLGEAMEPLEANGVHPAPPSAPPPVALAARRADIDIKQAQVSWLMEQVECEAAMFLAAARVTQRHGLNIGRRGKDRDRNRRFGCGQALRGSLEPARVHDVQTWNSPPFAGAHPSETIPMPANSVDYAADESKAAVKDAAAGATKMSAEAQRSFAEAAKRIERAVTEGIEQLRAQTRTYSDTAGQQIDQAQVYMTERVRERPLAATGAALGVGVLIGLLLGVATSSRR